MSKRVPLGWPAFLSTTIVLIGAIALHAAWMPVALLAAIATNPGLLEPLEGTIDNAFRRLTADSEDPSMALLVALAMDGLWLHRLVNSPVMDETQRLSIREKALELLGESAARAAPVRAVKSAR